MSQVLLVLLGLYLATCYIYGMVLLARLLRAKRVIRPTSRIESTELVRAAREELEQGGYEEERRIAA